MPTLKVVMATEALRRAKEGTDSITVTVVRILLNTNAAVGAPEDLVHYEQVRIVTYRLMAAARPEARMGR
ncbi:MAG TPA: hypothetical protein VGX72_11910 [Solirubrobacteraceae bacterium]|jgi:hypothetical protein|nr:hypothetical protein [Solirubrobacteraceae bacterium]